MIAVLSNFLASSRSVGTAATMAATGMYLHRLGIANDDSKKLLAKISQQVTIPALLFTKIVYCKQDSSQEDCPSIYDLLIDSAWTIIVWPVFVVCCGLVVGHLAASISNTPKHHRPLVLASCAFANSTGLPITLLSVIHQNFPPSTELGKIDPTLFLSLYLLFYPVLQWGVGGWLLMGDKDKGDRGSGSSIPSSGDSNDEEVDSGSKKGMYESIPSPHKDIDGDKDDQDQDTTFSFSEQESTLESGSSNDLEKLNLIESYHEQRINYKCLKTCEHNDQSDAMEEESHRLWGQLQKAFGKALQPPVVGSLLGLFIASFEQLRGIIVDMKDRNDNAPIEFIYDGLYSIGQAAVPINMMILGINLSKTIQTKPNPKDVLSAKSTFAVIFAKMVVMPIIGILSVLFLKHFVWNIPDDIDDAFYLVLMIVFITPTANNVMIMVELGDNVSKEGISRLLGWQYAFAPVLLSINVSIIVYLVK